MNAPIHDADELRDLRREDDDMPTRTARELTDAAESAMHIDASELSDTVLRTVGNTIASYAMHMGPEKWMPAMERLRSAAVAYGDWHPEAELMLFPEEIPF